MLGRILYPAGWLLGVDAQGQYGHTFTMFEINPNPRTPSLQGPG